MISNKGLIVSGSALIVVIASVAYRRFVTQPSRTEDRYYVNNLPDYQGVICEVDNVGVQSQINEYISDIKKNFPSDWRGNGKKDTLRPQNVNSSNYTGTTGLAYFWWRKHKNNPQDEFVQISMEYLNRSEQLDTECPIPCAINGILIGAPGYHCVKSLVLDSLGKEEECQKSLQRFIEFGKHATVQGKFTHDTLFGTTGYLSGCVLLQKYFPSFPSSFTDSVGQYLVESGKNIWRKYFSGKKNEKNERLAYIFFTRDLIPQTFYAVKLESTGILSYFLLIFFIIYILISARKNVEFYGLGHGHAATLYFLMGCSSEFISKNEQIIRNSLEYIRDLCNASSEWPIMSSTPNPGLVHWCHGAPGYVYLFGRAWEIFNDDYYLDLALRAGEDVWEKGLIKKGPGLCHGIAGNGYVLLYLYKITKDPKWLHRGRQFAHFIVVNAKSLRKADRPYSLYEGVSGTVLFLEDILKDNINDVNFPLFESL